MKFKTHFKQMQAIIPGRYCNYTALKSAIKAQAKTGETGHQLFNSLVTSELQGVDEFFREKEKDILALYNSLVSIPNQLPKPSKSDLDEEDDDDENNKGKQKQEIYEEPWQSLKAEELVSVLEELEDHCTSLLSYIVLNYTAFEKMIKTHYRQNKDQEMKHKWMDMLNNTYFFKATLVDSVLYNIHYLQRAIRKRHKRKIQQEAVDTAIQKKNKKKLEEVNDLKIEDFKEDSFYLSTWGFISGTFTHQFADNANKLIVPLIFLKLTSVPTTAFLCAILSAIQSVGDQKRVG
eukprot:TRINITY_DN7495_c0_g1_i1.p1 TRINITY_DN7495_c0_g1~~TRINITY_DN7495_c0_g1_i1.p1  ORF type:complete len:291 (-),score=63.00 TRINITY_DN7495_c0_g1_i1:411-1283(-)